ncbi:MAG: Holliday junction ATP-dependent DNA helicase RuvA [Eubacteriales bacterium SKADARSKE-1]|nr:Holliday junction ATP-dependent DNA helicase RuvA [Eubacteriales bacterium SKADARSKE-1]
MFYSLRGQLVHLEDGIAVVECAGVGYKCFVTANTQKELLTLGQEVTLYTHLNVREDAMDLFGFLKKEELDCFKLLISVSGVGAKVGIAILSSLLPEQVFMAISTGDSKILTVAPGVGSKLAQRVILELKDKVRTAFCYSNEKSVASNFLSNNNTSKALAALTSLGYLSTDVMPIVSSLDSSLPVEELIRLSLKSLAGRF